MALGDGTGALAAYRKSLAIGEGLAAHDPANTRTKLPVARTTADFASKGEPPHDFANSFSGFPIAG